MTNGVLHIEAQGSDIHFRMLDGSWYISSQRGIPVRQPVNHGRSLRDFTDNEPVPTRSTLSFAD